MWRKRKIQQCKVRKLEGEEPEKHDEHEEIQEELHASLNLRAALDLSHKLKVVKTNDVPPWLPAICRLPKISLSHCFFAF